METITRPSSPYASASEKHNDGPYATLTHELIVQAMGASPDGSQTLDFSSKNIKDVGLAGAEELANIGVSATEEKSIVMRIALGYNHLSSLPINFTLLSRLRYLNLRANAFTVFPHVLTVMPSLEILDISRNKLKELPQEPGSLLQLRVFSMSRNKLTRLPLYFSNANNLTVLHIEHNPIEWPPRNVIEPLEKSVDDPDSLLLHIEGLRRWLKSHEHSMPPNKSGMRDEAAVGSSLEPSSVSDTDPSDEGGHPFPPPSPELVSTLHGRSFSAESDVSNYSFLSDNSVDSENPVKENNFTYNDSPKPTGFFRRPNASNPLFSPPSPPSDTVLANADSSSISTLSTEPPSSSHTSDNRSVVPSANRHVPSSRVRPKSKKSSPELRSNITNLPSDSSQTSMTSKVISEEDTSRGPKPRSRRRPEDVYDVPDSFSRFVASKHNRVARSQPYNTRNGHSYPFLESIPSPLPTLPRPAPSMDVERNSYFRRLSTLPPPSTTIVIPEALLAMVESARGILFGVSQIYQSLRHYTVFAIDDRLSGVLEKVLNPASTYMTHLITALDRFDSISRRGIPPPSVCRGVLESCKDNMAGFGKVIGVLHLQLKVLAGADDARYSRSLILMLYGSMGEIANSWKTMSSHLDAILPFLSERTRPSIQTSTKLQQQPSLHVPDISSPGIEGHSPILKKTGANGVSRLTRRHAGSFSTQDLIIGRTLPSTNEEHAQSHPLPLRSALRRPSQNTSQTELQTTLSDFMPKRHVHEDSIIPENHATSPPPLSFMSSQQIVHSTPRAVHSSLVVPSDSSKMVDQDLLDTMEGATETARSVWKMMGDVLRISQDTNANLQDALALAADITGQLRSKIGIMRNGADDDDRKSFWEVAHSFVKAVVNILTILKACSTSYPFSHMLRANIAKLTQSTQDFAILLQVSSFSPAPTPGPYSPAISGLPSTPARSAGISRSKSAQATQAPSHASIRPNELIGRETPWSALPHQSFRISDQDV